MLPASAQAATFDCISTIANVDVSSSNDVWIQVSYGYFRVCSIKVAWGGVAPEACNSWYAAFLTAKTSGRPVQLFFDTSVPENAGLTSACTTANFGNWTAHPPYWMSLR